ncbi:MAG: aldo/keto reductase [Bifidobacteriaceae bacterium]|jgi:L-galactose dehydrogenase|nr:aldo/keto reductase [Bifidobacteriaceae bacterium]MCI1914485.1 aldo/keto reductase [Bifidobacteriaceae bacterium]
MQTRQLGNTGLTVPVLSLGGAPLGSLYGEITQEQANETIRVALENGMNMIDSSPWYSEPHGQRRSETTIGRALKGIDRSEYILTTKCGRYMPGEWDFSTERIKRSIPESMEKLGVDHIDVVQCHDIEEGDLDQVINEALPVLRDYKEQGMIGFIGVTGYKLDVLEKVAVEQNLDTMMSYCNYNLQDRRLLDTSRRLKEHGIGVFNCSPLHMGALTTKGAPDWHPAHPEVLALVPQVVEACKEAGTTIEQVALEFSLNSPADSGISTTVVGGANPKHLLGDIAALGKTPDPALIKRIEDIFGPWLNVGWDMPAPAGAKE